MRLSVITVTGALLLSIACTSEKAPVVCERGPESPTSLSAPNKITQIDTRDLITRHEHSYRRGAAVEGSGDKHFFYATGGKDSPLADNRVRYDRLHVSDSRAPSLPADNDYLEIFRQGHIKDYSYYELSRWQRFCNVGKGMDKLDFIFIKEAVAGKHVFPVELQQSCQPPAKTVLRKHGIKI